MTPIESITTTTATVHRKVEAIEVHPNVSVFRIRYDLTLPSDVPNTLREYFKGHVQQGYATPAAIDQYLRDEVSTLDTIPGLLLVPDMVLDKARTEGYPHAFKDIPDLDTFGWHPFDKFKSGKVTTKNLVFNEWASHLLFDCDRKLIPCARFFSSLNGRVHNDAYDLEKLIAVLKDNPQVVPLSTKVYGEPVNAESLSIQMIPSCNQEGEGEYQVSFRFLPTDEQMAQIWEQMQSYKTEYPSTEFYRAMFDLDVLGLRKGGAAKFETWG